MELNQFLKLSSAYTSWTMIGPMLAEDSAWSEFKLRNEKKPCVYVDRGADFKKQELGLSVGDGDSANSPMDIKLNPEKDFTDFEYALGLIPQTLEHLKIFGFLGGRKDHELANFGCLYEFLMKRENLFSISMSNLFLGLSQGKRKLTIKGNFSILCFEKTQLLIQGDCQYLLSEPSSIKILSGRTLSNKAWGDVVISHDVPIFIYCEQGLNKVLLELP